MGGIGSERSYCRYKSRDRAPAIGSRWAMHGACGDKDITVLLLPEQCSLRRSYSLWRPDPCFSLFLVRGLHSAFSVRKLSLFFLKLSIPLRSILLPFCCVSLRMPPFSSLNLQALEIRIEIHASSLWCSLISARTYSRGWGLCCMRVLSKGARFLVCETAPFERACIFHSYA